MKIKVTQEDINRGVEFNPWFCPIALAVHRRYPNSKVLVNRDYLRFATGNYQTPNEVRIFVDRFDLGKPVQPFEFEVSR